MKRFLEVHTPVTMNEGREDEQRLQVGERFEMLEEGTDFLTSILLADGDTVIGNFGGGLAAFSITPDSQGRSYATNFTIVEEE